MPPITPQKNYQALWFTVYFGILFQGFMVLLQRYLQQDRLSFEYFFLLGIPSALIALVVERLISQRNLTIKIGVVVFLLATLTMIAIGVRSIDNF